MARSVYTIFHTFAASALTNTTVSSEYIQLLRILVYWKDELVNHEDRYFDDLKAKKSFGHLPDLSNFMDVVNLLALLNFADMAWILTPS